MAAGALAATVALGQGLGAVSQVTWRYLAASPDERAMLMFAETMSAPATGPYHCFFAKPEQVANIAGCLPQGRAQIVVWGDSHAASLSRGFDGVGVVSGLLAGPGCAPLLDDGWTLLRDCARQNPVILAALRQNPPQVLVLHAYWRSKRDQLRLLPSTIADLRRDLPQTQIVVLGGMPYWLPSLPERIVAEGVVGQGAAMIPAQLTAVVAADDRIAAVLATEIAAGDVTFVRPTDVLCHDGLCPAFAGGMPYASDYGHLTVQGATDFVRRLQGMGPDLWPATK